MAVARPRFEPALGAEEFAGGRTWWAHINLTRINIEPLTLCNQVEEIPEIPSTGLYLLMISLCVTRRPVSRSRGESQQISRRLRVVGAVVGARCTPLAQAGGLRVERVAPWLRLSAKLRGHRMFELIHLDGELDATACDAIERRCRACPECAEVVRVLREPVGLCRQMASAPLSQSVRQRARDGVRRLLDWEAPRR